PRSRQYSLHHGCRHRTGQLLIQALKLVSKFVVVYAQAMENRGIEVAHVHRILYNVVAVIVGLAISNSRPHASTRHPDGEAAGVMVAAIVFLAQSALAVHRTSEFARPDD